MDVLAVAVVPRVGERLAGVVAGLQHGADGRAADDPAGGGGFTAALTGRDRGRRGGRRGRGGGLADGTGLHGRADRALTAEHDHAVGGQAADLGVDRRRQAGPGGQQQRSGGEGRHRSAGQGVREAGARREVDRLGRAEGVLGHRGRRRVAVHAGDAGHSAGAQRSQRCLDGGRDGVGPTQDRDRRGPQAAQLVGRGSGQRTGRGEQDRDLARAGGRSCRQGVGERRAGRDVGRGDAGREGGPGDGGGRGVAVGARQPVDGAGGPGLERGQHGAGDGAGAAQHDDPGGLEPRELCVGGGGHRVAAGQQDGTAQRRGGRTTGQGVGEGGPGRDERDRHARGEAGGADRSGGAVAVGAGQALGDRRGGRAGGREGQTTGEQREDSGQAGGRAAGGAGGAGGAGHGRLVICRRVWWGWGWYDADDSRMCGCGAGGLTRRVPGWRRPGWRR